MSCTYMGQDMKRAHSGMGVSGSEFDALASDLVVTLNKYKVGDREKNELLGALGPMKQDIVENPTASLSAPKESDIQEFVRWQDERAGMSF